MEVLSRNTFWIAIERNSQNLMVLYWNVIYESSIGPIVENKSY